MADLINHIIRVHISHFGCSPKLIFHVLMKSMVSIFSMFSMSNFKKYHTFHRRPLILQPKRKYSSHWWIENLSISFQPVLNKNLYNLLKTYSGTLPEPKTEHQKF